MDITESAWAKGEPVLVNKGRHAQREGRYGRNGMAWTTRCATNKTKCATDKIGNKFSFCRPPFTIFAGRQTPDRQVECRENFVRIRI